MAGSFARLIEFESIDSTNSEALRRAAAAERGPLWIRSDLQEAARGRSGRAWSSPAGNLALTLLFSPGCDPQVMHQLSFVAGLAGFDAIRPFLRDGSELQLKWPNDLLIGSAKMGGILVESSRHDGAGIVVIGFGINIAVAPPVAERAVTRLADHGSAPSAAELAGRIMATLPDWLERWQRGRGFAAIRTAWLERAHHPGQRLRVHLDGARQEGTFADLGADGALLMATRDGDLIRVAHGDVCLVSATSPQKDHA